MKNSIIAVTLLLIQVTYVSYNSSQQVRLEQPSYTIGGASR